MIVWTCMDWYYIAWFWEVYALNWWVCYVPWVVRLWIWMRWVQFFPIWTCNIWWYGCLDLFWCFGIEIGRYQYENTLISRVILPFLASIRSSESWLAQAKSGQWLEWLCHSKTRPSELAFAQASSAEIPFLVVSPKREMPRSSEGFVAQARDASPKRDRGRIEFNIFARASPDLAQARIPMLAKCF